MTSRRGSARCSRRASSRRCCFLSRWMGTPVAPSSGRSRPYHDGGTRKSCLICAHGIAQETCRTLKKPSGETRRDKMNGPESLVRKCRPVVVGADRHQHAATTHILARIILTAPLAVFRFSPPRPQRPCSGG